MAKTKQRKSRRLKQQDVKGDMISDNESAREKLVKLLSSLKDTPGKFATDGVVKQSPLPGLHIEGIGPICLPLCCSTAKRIIEIANEAPFGLGEQTVIDKNVRKSWEIDPNKILLKNPRFHSELKSLVLKVKAELGCDSNNVKANLYKALLYEEGGHFKPHTDSEKENGMFGTLIVQLPSIFKGNHLLVHHDGKTIEVEFDSKHSEYDIIYAAHYADCKHEITPLESGYRLALIYNLVWTAPSAPPSVDDSERTKQVLSDLLLQIDEEHESVFGLTLDHQYSNSSLKNGIAALKGKDRRIAATLKAANESLTHDKRYNFYITKINRETVEAGEHDGVYYDSDEDPYNSDYGEFEPCEMCDDETELKDCYDFNGIKHAVDKIPFDVEKNLLDFEEKFNGDVEEFWGEFYEEDLTGPTGNEGASRSRWYSNYIVLMIPKSQQFLLAKIGNKRSNSDDNSDVPSKKNVIVLN